jgi:uncharacterized protein
LKVVADTNVLVSALAFPGGVPEEIYRLVLSRRVMLVTSVALLKELRGVLLNKLSWEAARVETVLQQIVELALIVSPVTHVFDIDVDPPDNRILEAAAEGGAVTIISGDKHLLNLGAWRGVAILSPRAFLESIE